MHTDPIIRKMSEMHNERIDQLRKLHYSDVRSAKVEGLIIGFAAGVAVCATLVYYLIG